MHFACQLEYFIFSIITPIPKLPLVFWAANSVFSKKKTENSKDKFQHNFGGFKYLVIEKTLILQLFLRPHKALENSNTLLQVWAPLCLFATNHFRCELRHKNEEFTFCFSFHYSTVFLLSFKTQLILPQTISFPSISHQVFFCLPVQKNVQCWE